MGAGRRPLKAPGKKNPQGWKKKFKPDAIHGIKKGRKGNAAQYMPRAQALAKLQLSLADFRKLCILKGIYPRDPKKKNAGSDKTYYHKKDMAFLLHEPIMRKFFELKTFMKKFKKAMGRGQRGSAKDIETRKPTYTLSHLVRERYVNFEDALRDLDDGLSMLALFQALPADQVREIPTDAVNEAARLYQEWQLYIIRAQALRKVFASIKGYYFQAEVQGTVVTWLQPHTFPQNLPPEVDFKVMLTFLEFYRTVLKFVNFKLYADLGLSYPPKRQTAKDLSGAEVASLETEMREAGLAREEKQEAEKKEDADISKTIESDFGIESQEALDLQKKLAEQTRMKNTFRGIQAYINREVPLRPIYFVLLCGGVDTCGWERSAFKETSCGPGSISVRSNRITHQIVDRPADQFEKREGREFVQPQWVFDSFNMGCQLPVALYAPGRAPPPHLSPFVDDKAEGYVPRQREVLDQLAAEVTGSVLTPAGSSAAPVAVAEGPEAAMERYSEELKAESEGIWHSKYAEEMAEKKRLRDAEILKQSEIDDLKEPVKEVFQIKMPEDESLPKPLPAEPGPKPTEEEEELMRRKALMNKRNKRLLSRIDYSKKEKEDEKERLLKRRRVAEREQLAKKTSEGD